jgi:hypothetical protein
VAEVRVVMKKAVKDPTLMNHFGKQWFLILEVISQKMKMMMMPKTELLHAMRQHPRRRKREQRGIAS